MKLSERIRRVEASKTVRFTSLIDTLRREGKEVINFAVGEPEYETPAEIVRATKEALNAGATRYGPVSGWPELRTALARPFDGYNADNLLIANGSKQCLYAFFQIICNPGDEVIIPSPYWVSFSQQVILAGGRPVLVETRNHQLDCDAIEQAITPRTVAILVNSPNNPTGAVYPRSDLEFIARLALKYDLCIISDEAYDFFIYDGLAHESFLAFEEIRDRLVVTKSFSKSYSMTGFRLGYMVAPREIIRALAKLQSHSTGNVCTFAQHGALAALSLDHGIIGKWRAELERKRDMAYGHTSELFECVRPQGAFYLFPDVSQHLRKGETAEDFSAYLLENAGVAVVPGEAFGMANHVRISYAVPEDLLSKGFKRISEALARR